MMGISRLAVAGCILMGLGAGPAHAQVKADTLAYDWYLQDNAASPYFGISLDKAYTLLKGRKPQKVVVGIVDSGVDTLHEDLQPVLWVNRKAERSYPGEHYGWSFLGSKKGNISKEQLELTRVILALRTKGDTTGADYRALLGKYEEKKQEAAQAVRGVDGFIAVLNGIIAAIGKQEPKLSDFTAYAPKDDREKQVLAQVAGALAQKDDYAAFYKQVTAYREHFRDQLDYDLNFAYQPRAVVGDRPGDVNERFYGSPDVKAADPLHGTHVAGIIGAERNNGKGINGVADDVSLLAVRAVPDGDERDKDIANAIRYAADHGARVINMSFGKNLSPDKQAVDEAVRYAISKDVLLVHAAGNDHANNDSTANFPNRRLLAGGEADAWIEVGASGPYKDNLVAPFSNYGGRSVDLFAPGVDIYSTLPGNAYGRESGTSMACPVVAGIAALIRSYFPRLTALQVKDILMRSVVTDPALSGKCVTGGVVNAAKAVQLAIDYTAGQKS